MTIRTARPGRSRAVDDDPAQAAAWFNLGRCLQAAGRPAEAVDALVRAESLAPRDTQATLAIAIVLARLGAVDRALAIVDRLLARDPELAPALELKVRLRDALTPR